MVVRDADTGALMRYGRAPHPDGTEVDPAAWAHALDVAIAAAGGLAGIDALSVAAQQHGMVALDDSGAVVRPALLWNDTRSAPQAAALVAELGGGAWAKAVGSVPVASFTITKLRWMAENEPHHAARTAAVALPHDWLTWRLLGSTSIDGLVTDRGDASGTGYWSASTGSYRTDLLAQALGHQALLPAVLGPAAVAGSVDGLLVGPGTGDNAGAALGLGAAPGDLVLSIGTSGVACAVAEQPSEDASGTVAGFADATGHFLPLVATLNAARVLDAVASLLRVSHEELSALALSAPAGADGVVLLPYLEGERTPNLPSATGSLHGLRLASMTAAHIARAAVEGLLCGLADAVDSIVAQGHPVSRILLIGGGARSEAVRQIAPTILGLPVTVPAPSEYVADGAARQAAWVLSGAPAPPAWEVAGAVVYDGDPQPAVRERYAEERDRYVAQ